MTTQPIPVAIIGLGRAGWNLHLRPILQLPGFKVTAVADPVAERTQEAADQTGCRQFSNIDDLLADTDAQVVVVATPSSTHYSDTLKVLRSGRHCIAEKPLALSAKEADELVSLAREKNLHLFINHAHLHGKEFHAINSVLQSGILGPIFHLRTFWGHYARRWDWQTLRKNGGGQLNNTCPHTLSLVLPLLGSPVKRVVADLRNIKDAGDAEDHVELLLFTENGATANVVVSSAIAAAAPKWIISGKYGTLTCNAGVITLKYYNPAEAPELSVLDTAAPGRQYLREELPWKEETRKVDDHPEIPAFHANALAVLQGKAEPIVTAESAAEVVRVTETAYREAGIL